MRAPFHRSSASSRSISPCLRLRYSPSRPMSSFLTTSFLPTVTAGAKLRDFYPPIDPYDTGFLKVSDIHTLYYEQAGNPTGKPAIVVHGGPGGGSVPYYRTYFDPKVYRIINFDQRGAGKSTPLACLEENTTWHLVEDIERLRKQLGIDKWTVVFGGSWGSTLSLAYAETHPDRVKALVLRGIFLCRRKELLWFYQEGASFLFPDAWEEFLKPIPLVERGDLISAYQRRLTGKDDAVKKECARAWSIWEMSTSRLYVDPAAIRRAADDDKFAVSFARIESHYFVNGAFFRCESQLLDDIGKIRNIPAVAVCGRYDIVCPNISAFDLHKAFPEMKYIVVPDAGHSAKEVGIVHHLIEATDSFRNL